MKKIIAVALLSIMMLGFGACNSDVMTAKTAEYTDSETKYAMVKLPNGEIVSGRYTEAILYNESNIKIVFEDRSEYRTHPINVVRYTK